MSPPLSTPSSQKKKNMKLDPQLLVTDSAMYAAIPVLPLPVAVLCFLFNVFAPGLGKRSFIKFSRREEIEWPQKQVN